MAMAIIKTAQSVKPLPALALVQVPPSLFPVNTSGKAVAGGLQAGVPATCFGDLDGVLDTVAGICESEPGDSHSVCVCQISKYIDF